MVRWFHSDGDIFGNIHARFGTLTTHWTHTGGEIELVKFWELRSCPLYD